MYDFRIIYVVSLGCAELAVVGLGQTVTCPHKIHPRGQRKPFRLFYTVKYTNVAVKNS
jgi:hypothetical protein